MCTHTFSMHDACARMHSACCMCTHACVRGLLTIQAAMMLRGAMVTLQTKTPTAKPALGCAHRACICLGVGCGAGGMEVTYACVYGGMHAFGRVIEGEGVFHRACACTSHGAHVHTRAVSHSPPRGVRGRMHITWRTCTHTCGLTLSSSWSERTHAHHMAHMYTHVRPHTLLLVE